MSQWNSNDPGAGDTAEIDAVRGELDGIAAQLSGDGGLEARSGVRWTYSHPTCGRARQPTSTEERGAELSRQALYLGRSLQIYTSGLTLYSGRLAEIDESFQKEHKLLTEAQSDVESARGDNPASRRTTSTPAEASSDVVEANQEVTRIKNRIDALSDERLTANNALRTALSTGLGSSFVTIGEVMARSGIISPADINYDTICDALIKWANDLTEGDPSEGDITAYANLLAQICGNATECGRFLQELGPEAYAELLLALDQLDGASAGGSLTETIQSTQALLRQALSSASTLWDQDTCTDFANGLVAVGPDDGALVVSYLFGDAVAAPMSASFTMAMADAIQAKEIETGTPRIWISSIDDPTDEALSPMSMAAARIDVGAAAWWRLDPAVAVFSHLQLYPNETLAWLADSTLAGKNDDGEEITVGQVRIEHWFSDRGWALGDINAQGGAGPGFDAPMALWSTLQNMEAAYLGEAYQSETARQLGIVNAQIIDGLSKNSAISVGELSAAAAMSLTEVLDKQLPYWLESVIIGGDYDEPSSENYGIDWLGESVFTSRFESGALRWLLQQIVADDAAAEQCATNISNLQLALLAAGASADSALSGTAALNRVAALLGVVDSARWANELQAGKDEDEAVSVVIDSGSFIANQVGGAAATAAAGALGGVLSSVGVSALGDAADDQWASNYDQAMMEFWEGGGTVDEREARAREFLSGLIDAGLVDSTEVYETNPTEDQYLDEVMRSYRGDVNHAGATQTDQDRATSGDDD